MNAVVKKSELARHAVLMLLCAIVALPFIWMIWLSFLAPHAAAAMNVSSLQFAVVHNYVEAATQTPLLRFEINGVVVCGAILLLHILTGAPAAYALAKLRLRGSGFIIGVLLVAILIPSQVIAVPLFVGFYGLHLLDSYAALIVPGTVSPLTIFLLYQVFRTVPDDYIHAARLDGMNEWSIVWSVMLPFARPTLATIAILVVVARWNDLFWPSTVISSLKLMPPPMGIILFRDQEAGSGYGPLMAAAVMVVAPLLIGFILAQRRFIDSFTASLPK